jgi:hypothetical protein
LNDHLLQVLGGLDGVGLLIDPLELLERAALGLNTAKWPSVSILNADLFSKN